MRKRAYNRALLSDGTVVNEPVVVITGDDGSVIEWHRLQQEEAMTEWIGGETQIFLK